ncbi:MAG: FliM/FliN family flagellar motor switch protein, partial [Gammaproteobacteria bacterium]|nr:FliM/FliN family flagellar motor switch protein [Gammaproteobacteria bacterium]
DRADGGDSWRSVLGDQLNEAEVELNTVLTRKLVNLKDLLNIRPGDVIPVDLPDEVFVYASGVPVFKGVFGKSRGFNAVKMTEPVYPTARDYPKLEEGKV